MLCRGAEQHSATLPEESSQAGMESEELRAAPMDGSHEKHLH